MIPVEQTKKKKSVWNYLISVLILASCLFLFLIGTGSMAERTEAEQLNVLTQAIQRASVQCYAIEGRYPPSVEYLEEHYGLTIDREKYNVFYSGWASNIMPDITVIPVNES